MFSSGCGRVVALASSLQPWPPTLGQASWISQGASSKGHQLDSVGVRNETKVEGAYVVGVWGECGRLGMDMINIIVYMYEITKE